eukprot:TRINITY_DN18326_c1_g1_i1.p1 TRINITY_DN18326_c1_g1~~TRINITY_DN18326_c1_g1_i1.p1  ORF type:complete len:102 (-),score=2.41 TRINITY_DN18326_c1_g1_i1:1477-1782(-)
MDIDQSNHPIYLMYWKLIGEGEKGERLCLSFLTVAKFYSPLDINRQVAIVLLRFYLYFFFSEMNNSFYVIFLKSDMVIVRSLKFKFLSKQFNLYHLIMNPD